ncbi:MAG: DUF2442 domain-containing protein [SAR324 cluster bacterium]|nr:DUF2442 domain-containing protein [SAR324 cluster bacterium]MBF0351897.1 DUF2442 domain-containing protein [SAR324 cluster bacterium]
MKKIPKIKAVQALDNHLLIIEFSNHENRQYDVRPLLKLQTFAPLQNDAFFKNVQIETGGHALVWNEDIDISEYELWSKGQFLS